ncbi:trihelix transcription factor ASIL1-like [Miscanthus floridulus]|uniref:trihelix transcription factor ASIL1-like n=1 Tax=Miscanthus floridulus TaxID=154761 RepID=UPI0034580CDE
MMADDPPRRPPSALERKSAPAQPWSHVETMHLIDAYEERWTALRRGQLKAHQWEEVAAEVVARCAATPGVVAQRKTGTQCRHKLEKLRKRYRTEGARPVTSLWPYFRRMDRLERGPLAASSAYSAAGGSPPAADGDEEEEEEEEEEDVQEEEGEEEEELVPRNNTRSINGIIREFGTGLAPRHPQLQLYQPPPSSITPSTAPPRKRVAYEAFQAKAAVKAKDGDNEAVETAQRGGGSSGRGAGGAGAQLSAVLRDFGEGVMRLERRRMEVQWEIERGWQEADDRHARMLQDAQRLLRDTVAAACALPPKKARRDHGDS